MIVAGNAAELRALAEKAQAGDTEALEAASTDGRVRQLLARARDRAQKRPDLGTVDEIAATAVGKPRCATIDGPLTGAGPIWWGTNPPYATAGTLILPTTVTNPAPVVARPDATVVPAAPAASLEPAERSEAGHERKPLALTQDGDQAEMYLYGDIDSWGGWWGISAEEFLDELSGCTASSLTVHVNSYGGEVFEGLAIKTALQRCPAKVTVTVDSIAASIASVIAMAGDEVVMGDPSMLMIHDPWMYCVGDAAEMLRSAAVLDEIGDMLAGVYTHAARGRGGDRDVAAWRDLMRSELWMSQDRAVAEHLADRVDRVEAEPTNRAPAVPRARAEPPAEVVLDVATPVHHTAVEEGTWDASANLGRIDWPASKDKAKAVSCGYRDDMVDDDGTVPRGAVFLPHHFVDADGNVGAASIAGVNAAKARLAQTQGISESERATAEAHLNAHQDDYSSDDTDDSWADTVAHLTTNDWDDLTEALTT